MARPKRPPPRRRDHARPCGAKPRARHKHLPGGFCLARTALPPRPTRARTLRFRASSALRASIWAPQAVPPARGSSHGAAQAARALPRPGRAADALLTSCTRATAFCGKGPGGRGAAQATHPLPGQGEAGEGLRAGIPRERTRAGAGDALAAGCLGGTGRRAAHDHAGAVSIVSLSGTHTLAARSVAVLESGWARGLRVHTCTTRRAPWRARRRCNRAAVLPRRSRRAASHPPPPRKGTAWRRAARARAQRAGAVPARGGAERGPAAQGRREKARWIARWRVFWRACPRVWLPRRLMRA